MKTSITYIESIICAGEDISPSDLQLRDRTEEVCTARQLIMIFAMKYGNSESSAGGHFGLDHSTAHHAKKSISDRCDTDKYFRAKFNYYDNLFKQTKNTALKADFIERLMNLQIDADKLNIKLQVTYD